MSKIIIIVVVSIVIALLIGVLFIFEIKSFTSSFDAVVKTNVSYSEAKKLTVIKMFVPPQARDICYWSYPIRLCVVANFKIDEKDFVDWAKKSNWELKIINEPNSGYEIRNISSQQAPNPNDIVIIKHGYIYEWVYNQKDPGSIKRIFAYDKDAKLGFFTQGGD